MGYGQNIKSARRAAGLTQEQLAQKCGMATVTISQYERDVREPRAEQLQCLANALNVHVLELMGFPASVEHSVSFDLKVDVELLAKRISKKYQLSLDNARNIVDDCFKTFQLDGKHIDSTSTMSQLFDRLPPDARQEALNYANYLLSKDSGNSGQLD